MTREEWIKRSRAYFHGEFHKSIEETTIEGLEEIRKMALKYPHDDLKTKELLFEIVDTINGLKGDIKSKEEHKNEYE